MSGMTTEYHVDDDFDDDILLSADVLDELERNSKVVASTSCSKSSATVSTYLLPPDDFSFPIKPYSIQADFMHQLFKTIESGHVGIFESPTGTGKSLSLVCGSLTWLRMDEERRKKEFDSLMVESEQSKTSDDWIRAFAENEERLNRNNDFIQRHKELQQREKELLRWKHEAKRIGGSNIKKRKIPFGNSTISESSDSDNEKSTSLDIQDDDKDVLLENYDSDDERKLESEQNDIVDSPKVIYCSRTHSQLAQFLNEVKKTSFSRDIRCVTLGSRQTFCINEMVRKLNQVALINDRCLQLQKDKSIGAAKKVKTELGGRRSNKGCLFNKQSSVQELSHSLLLNGVRDVENIISESRNSHACPYYAGRRAVADAQLVLVPYQVLLHKATRDSCGLRVRGNILIVDEAHNLLDTLSAIHSIEISIIHLESARLQLERYLQRFGKRLSPKNLMYIRHLTIIVDNLIKCLKKADSECVYSLMDFVFHAEIDTINIFKVIRFMEISHISQKLNAYANRYLQESSSLVNDSNDKGIDGAIATSPFHILEAFLNCLIQRFEDGRIIIAPANSESKGRRNNAKLKFIHLQPSVHFKELCKDARSVILAGGTMEPVNDLIDRLFTPCGIATASIDRFSCGHIVDDENLLPVILDKGPSGVTFDFTFNNKHNETMIRDLGRLLINATSVVRGGIVCFFQSYDYEAFVIDHWSKSGILQSLEKKKKIFREPARASEVNTILNGYAKYAKTNNGAIMFAVVGGKLSEGINFADDLGRMVVMIGLPYPNSNSVELKEKMRMLNDRSGDSQSGQQYYENLCMKAINQSIGRVIRHQHDYAIILFLDKGYMKPTIQKKLPLWIGKLIRKYDSFGLIYSTIKEFFTRMESKYLH